MESQTFGEKIRAMRLDLGYSLKYVGKEIEYSSKLLSEIERNKRSAPKEIIKSLAILYQIPYRGLMIKYLSEQVYYKVRLFEGADEALEIAKKRLQKEKRGTSEEKSKEKIIEIIRSYFSQAPVKKAWLFGSVARENFISKDSDIDILVSFRKSNKVSLFDLVEMKEELSVRTGREIDLVERGRELNSFKEQIETEKFLIYAS